MNSPGSDRTFKTLSSSQNTNNKLRQNKRDTINHLFVIPEKRKLVVPDFKFNGFREIIETPVQPGNPDKFEYAKFLVNNPEYFKANASDLQDAKDDILDYLYETGLYGHYFDNTDLLEYFEPDN